MQEDEETDIDKKMSTLPERRNIEISNVSFSYNGSKEEFALKNGTLPAPCAPSCEKLTIRVSNFWTLFS